MMIETIFKLSSVELLFYTGCYLLQAANIRTKLMQYITEDEMKYVLWYRSLNRLERVAVNRWLNGHSQMLLFLRKYSQRLQRFVYLPTANSSDELPLHRR
jgi:hypothetical protein